MRHVQLDIFTLQSSWSDRDIGPLRPEPNRQLAPGPLVASRHCKHVGTPKGRPTVQPRAYLQGLVRSHIKNACASPDQWKIYPCRVVGRSCSNLSVEESLFRPRSRRMWPERFDASTLAFRPKHTRNALKNRENFFVALSSFIVPCPFIKLLRTIAAPPLTKARRWATTNSIHNTVISLVYIL